MKTEYRCFNESKQSLASTLKDIIALVCIIQPFFILPQFNEWPVYVVSLGFMGLAFKSLENRYLRVPDGVKPILKSVLSGKYLRETEYDFWDSEIQRLDEYVSKHKKLPESDGSALGCWLDRAIVDAYNLLLPTPYFISLAKYGVPATSSDFQKFALDRLKNIETAPFPLRVSRQFKRPLPVAFLKFSLCSLAIMLILATYSQIPREVLACTIIMALLSLVSFCAKLLRTSPQPVISCLHAWRSGQFDDWYEYQVGKAAQILKEYFLANKNPPDENEIYSWVEMGTHGHPDMPMETEIGKLYRNIAFRALEGSLPLKYFFWMKNAGIKFDFRHAEIDIANDRYAIHELSF